MTTNNVTAAAVTKPNVSAADVIGALRAARDTWLNGTQRAANEELYALLAKCFAFYETMSLETELAATLRTEFADYVAAAKLRFDGATHTLVKIARVVFDTDAKQASAYGIVLRRAQEAGQTAATLAAFIRDKGGIEKVRLAQGDTVERPSQEERANTGYVSVKGTVLARVESEALRKACDHGKAGEKVVLLATQEAGGKFVIHAMVTATSAINAAFGAVVSTQKAPANTVTVETRQRDKDEGAEANRMAVIAELLNPASKVTEVPLLAAA